MVPGSPKGHVFNIVADDLLLNLESIWEGFTP